MLFRIFHTALMLALFIMVIILCVGAWHERGWKTHDLLLVWTLFATPALIAFMWTAE